MFGTKEISLSQKLAGPLAQVLEILEESVAENMSRDVQESFAEIDSRMENITVGMENFHKKTSYDIQGLSKQMEIFSATGKMLENANEANRLLSSQFYDEKIIYPMVLGLFPIFDFISAAIVKLSSQPENQTALNYFNAIYAQMEQFLCGYGIEKFSSEKNATFDPKTMKPLKREATSDEKLSGLVAASLQCGFRVNEKVLRLESVSLYEYEALAS